MTAKNEILNDLQSKYNFYLKGMEYSLDCFRLSKDEKMKEKFNRDYFHYKELCEIMKYAIKEVEDYEADTD